MRETRTFPSTFEDDETDTLTDFQDDRFLSSRGRTYTHDPTRSRSQSLATTRPGAIGSGFSRASLTQNWAMDSFSNPLSIPNNRYNELQLPGSGRYGSYGVSRPAQNIYTSSSPTTMATNGYRPTDISNVSPFVRDVGQILLDDNSAFREMWAGMNHHPKDEHGGGSGTTSRRHSVSVVQGRRPTIIGFNAPESDSDEPPHSRFGQSYNNTGLLLTDDDLASDLGLLNIGEGGNDHPNGLSRGTTSQPSSLPIHAPITRAPATDRIVYQQLNMNLASNVALRHSIGSPVDNNVLPPGSSPLRAQVERDGDDHFGEGFGSSGGGQQQSQTRYSSGLHQPHARKSDAGLPQTLARAQLNQQTVISTPSPISPTSTRSFPSSSTTPVQRPPTSELSGGPSAGVNDLGRGVPLHAVPSHWHLYIVEFKAGRTDLFYSAELAHEIRVGDLVIVEADRGKDLGKVVNDTITLREVEAFQKAQASKIGGGEESGSPGGGSGGSKKDINPKKIFGKARNQDVQ